MFFDKSSVMQHSNYTNNIQVQEKQYIKKIKNPRLIKILDFCGF